NPPHLQMSKGFAERGEAASVVPFKSDMRETGFDVGANTVLCKLEAQVPHRAVTFETESEQTIQLPLVDRLEACRGNREMIVEIAPKLIPLMPQAAIVLLVKQKEQSGTFDSTCRKHDFPRMNRERSSVGRPRDNAAKRPTLDREISRGRVDDHAHVRSRSDVPFKDVENVPFCETRPLGKTGNMRRHTGNRSDEAIGFVFLVGKTEEALDCGTVGDDISVRHRPVGIANVTDKKRNQRSAPTCRCAAETAEPTMCGTGIDRTRIDDLIERMYFVILRLSARLKADDAQTARAQSACHWQPKGPRAYHCNISRCRTFSHIEQILDHDTSSRIWRYCPRRSGRFVLTIIAPSRLR